MARQRDTKAEYQARKARLAAQGETLYQRRNTAAQRAGYKSLADQTARRRSGDLTHIDQAIHAKAEGGKYVDNLGGGRWTFTTPKRDSGPDLVDRARLDATMNRAHNADANVTITVTWRHPTSGRTGTAKAGGSYGVKVRRIHAKDGDGLESIENELQNVTDSEMPAGAIITSVSLFFFPSAQRKAAA